MPAGFRSGSEHALVMRMTMLEMEATALADCLSTSHSRVMELEGTIQRGARGALTGEQWLRVRRAHTTQVKGLKEELKVAELALEKLAVQELMEVGEMRALRQQLQEGAMISQLVDRVHAAQVKRLEDLNTAQEEELKGAKLALRDQARWASEDQEAQEKKCQERARLQERQLQHSFRQQRKQEAREAQEAAVQRTATQQAAATQQATAQQAAAQQIAAQQAATRQAAAHHAAARQAAQQAAQQATAQQATAQQVAAQQASSQEQHQVKLEKALERVAELEHRLASAAEDPSSASSHQKPREESVYDEEVQHQQGTPKQRRRMDAQRDMELSRQRKEIKEAALERVRQARAAEEWQRERAGMVLVAVGFLLIGLLVLIMPLPNGEGWQAQERQIMLAAVILPAIFIAAQSWLQRIRWLR